MSDRGTAAQRTAARVRGPASLRWTALALLLLLGVVCFALLTRSWGLTGLSLGFLFGFAMQRAAFCGSALLSSVVLLKETRGMIGVLIAVGVSMAGFGILAALGVIRPNPKPFLLYPALVGGLVFGCGMVLSGGCVSGSLFKAAEGRLSSMLAVVGVALGTNLGLSGLLAPARRWLIEVSPWQGIPLGVDRVLGIGFASLTIPLGAAMTLVGWWLWRRGAPRSQQRAGGTKKPWTARGWSFAASGTVIGALGWLTYLASAAAGRNYPLGATESVSMAMSATVGSGVALIPFMLWLGLGVILGSAFSAWLRGDLRLRSADPATLLVAFCGGIVAGLGAVVGLGCFIGNALSGGALLSVHSLVFALAMVAANWVTTILYLRGWS